MVTQEAILGLIETRYEAVKRAIKALAGEGFQDGPDAGFLADIARKLPLYDDRMTPPQYRRARRALVGYLDRLEAIANGRKGEAPKPAPAQPVAAVPQDVWGIF
ncbi:hypothetical protein FV222_00275 [Methylobacterium sp. WL103]|uniref:hypothetical protein n=1 Tax=Methylobacterium sp. WL103 TaxID=2603891 RepID=UPI0011CCC96C|nr:hypothetical protein [Methylobacterium sp. WL103]TXN08941.1 hypothetical protein FV222_00275 [Methylobacterium sp. WL103]